MEAFIPCRGSVDEHRAMSFELLQFFGLLDFRLVIQRQLDHLPVRHRDAVELCTARNTCIDGTAASWRRSIARAGDDPRLLARLQSPRIPVARIDAQIESPGDFVPLRDLNRVRLPATVVASEDSCREARIKG